MRIVTDCAADLSVEEIKTLEIDVAPLFIQFEDEEVNSNNLTPDEFYDRLAEAYPKIPTTAQPSPGTFTTIYRKLAKATDQILSIHISSGLSGTIQSARLGAEQISEAVVTLFDSKTLSGGERFQVIAAALANKAGWAKEAIIERLEKIRASTEVIYCLETLEYLAHGGRIGRVQALAGSLLKIKPVIHVNRADGKYDTIGKSRTMRGTMDIMVNHLAELYQNDGPLFVSVMHGKLADTAETFAELLQSKLDVAKIEIARISPILGVHTGPGIVGATVVPMDLMEDLI